MKPEGDEGGTDRDDGAVTGAMQGASRAFLIGLREDGSPTCHPMDALEMDGAPVFNTYRKSAKARNFQRDPRAAVVLLDNWQAPPSGARRLRGVLEEITPGERPAAGNQPASKKPVGVQARVRMRVAQGKRLLLRLRIEG